MADSLLDNYNPLYDIHLRQYFALPHMQKHLQKMGLLESTLNLNGDEVYARHHAMMDMMLKNREAQLVKMAELRKKLDAAEKVECCRRIRSGQSPESHRQGKPSRSLSRNRAGQKKGSGDRQRRYSNSFEDRDYVQRIEEQNSDPVEKNTNDPYKRLSANAKRFNYLHKLDDNTLVAYKDNLKKQLQRLERFREISFGSHSVARQPPPPQTSWFFRRRSVLNMRGRKPVTGNKLNASHDNRTSCPPTTRKRKDSNTRLPPINPQRNRVPTKPPAPVSLQQVTTRLPPAAKKPAPIRGRSSNKRETTTTTTTTITAVSKSPQISNMTTLPAITPLTGHGIFTGARTPPTATAVETTDVEVLSDSEIRNEPSLPRLPVLETQKTFDRSSPILRQSPSEDKPVDVSDTEPEQKEEDHIPRQIVLDNIPPSHNYGDFENSDSEPEYAEEDKEPLEEPVVSQEILPRDLSPVEPLAVGEHHSPLASDNVMENERKLSQDSSPLPNPEEPTRLDESVHSDDARNASPVILTEESHPHGQQSPALPGSPAQSSPIMDVHSTNVVEHFETHDSTPQTPFISIHDMEHHRPQSPVVSDDGKSPIYDQESNLHSSGPQSPVLTDHIEQKETSSPVPNTLDHSESPPQSPVLADHIEHKETSSPALNANESPPQSPVPLEHDNSSQIDDSNVSDESNHREKRSISKNDAVELSSPIHSLQASEHFEISTSQRAETPEDRSNSPITNESSVTMHESTEIPAHDVLIVSEHDEHRTADSPVLTKQHSSSSETSINAENVSSAPQMVAGSEENVNLESAPEVQIHEPLHHDDQQEAPNSPIASDNTHSPILHVAAESPLGHADQASNDFEKEYISPVSEGTQHHEPAPHSPVLSDKEEAFESELPVHNAPEPVPHTPENLSMDFEKVKEELEGSTHSDQEHEKVSEQVTEHLSGVSENQEPREEPREHIDENRESPIDQHEEVNEHFDSFNHATLNSSIDNAPTLETSETANFAPRSPSVHTSDAEEETFNVQHHSPLTENQPAPRSPTEMELYNPSREIRESPVMSDNESDSGVPISDNINIGVHHDSPAKESTSPVETNPVEMHISAEQIDQPVSENQHYSMDIKSQSPVQQDLVHQEESEQAPVIIKVSNTQEVEEEREKSPESETVLVPNDLIASTAQSDNEIEEQVPQLHNQAVERKEWDDGNQHVTESSIYSESSDVFTTSAIETEPAIGDNAHSIHLDSIADENPHPDLMSQSIYVPHDETEEEDNHEKYDHESESEHSEASEGRHTEKEMKTTMKSGEDLKNNNDEDGSNDDDDEKNIGKEKRHGSNGNLVSETVSTTTHTTTSSAELPVGGILVDDGDETNISSL